VIESQFGSRPFIGRLTALENLDPAPATQPCRNLTFDLGMGMDVGSPLRRWGLAFGLGKTGDLLGEGRAWFARRIWVDGR